MRSSCRAWRSTIINRARVLGWSVDPPPLEDKLREVARRGTSFHMTRILITAVRLGGAPIGSLGIVGGALSDTVLQSVANLVAIGLERARGQTATARAEAARQSSELEPPCSMRRHMSSRRR